MHVPGKKVIQNMPDLIIHRISNYLNIIFKLYLNIDLPNKYRDIYINWQALRKRSIHNLYTKSYCLRYGKYRCSNPYHGQNNLKWCRFILFVIYQQNIFYSGKISPLNIFEHLTNLPLSFVLMHGSTEDKVLPCTYRPQWQSR